MNNSDSGVVAPLLVVGGALAATSVALVAVQRFFTPLEIIPADMSKLQTGYFHLERMDVKKGDRVGRGQVIGLMGADPNGGPRHLHWEVAPYPFPGGVYSRLFTINPEPLLKNGRFAWPVEEWEGRKPVISSGHRSVNPSRKTHAGADVMFARLASDTQPAKNGEGAPRFVAYRGSRILAADAGIVTRADWISTGFRVWIAHV